MRLKTVSTKQSLISWRSLSWSRNSSSFMEPQGSIRCDTSPQFDLHLTRYNSQLYTATQSVVWIFTSISYPHPYPRAFYPDYVFVTILLCPKSSTRVLAAESKASVLHAYKTTYSLITQSEVSIPQNRSLLSSLWFVSLRHAISNSTHEVACTHPIGFTFIYFRWKQLDITYCSVDIANISEQSMCLVSKGIARSLIYLFGICWRNWGNIRKPAARIVGAKPRFELGTTRREASKVTASSNLLVKSTAGQPTALEI